jgi:CheY-like chemotaxis protein
MKVNVPTAKRTFNDSGPALQFLVWMRRLWLLLTTWQRTAFNGNRALDFKRRGPVDVVISDLNMAEMDGFALAEAITADGCWPNIRRIAVTMQPLGRVEKKARASGFEAEFEKPAKMSELVKWIELNCGTVSA